MHRRATRILTPASLLLALALGGCFKNDHGDADDSDETLGTTAPAASTGTADTSGDATTVTTTGATDPTTGPASTSTSTTEPATTSEGSETTAPPAEGCDGYCTTIATHCMGPFTQYGSPEMCLASCAAFAPGTPGETAGNTLACRTYHAGVAADADDIHCTHAGPGGDMACGSNCEGFCAIAGNYCPDAWPDAAACNAACIGFDAAEKYDASDVGGDTLACRLYHVTAAAIDPATHCAHIKGDSPTCK